MVFLQNHGGLHERLMEQHGEDTGEGYNRDIAGELPVPAELQLGAVVIVDEYGGHDADSA
jgi:hypothetical protein